MQEKIIKRLRAAKARISTFCRTCGSVCVTLIVRTHVRRWRKVAQAGRPSWDERNRIIAGFIPDGSSVLDVGCGAQTLREHLPPGCRYQPCDVANNSANVIFCDLNAGVYPDVKERFDYVVCSGVFEYMRNPGEFLKRIPMCGRTVLMSYNTLRPDVSKFDRLAKNWINHFTRDELKALMAETGLEWTVLHTNNLGELIGSLRAKNEN